MDARPHTLALRGLRGEGFGVKRGMLTVEQLRARCIVDPCTHCWLWQGATTLRGTTPRLWTLDYAKVEKRAMSGPLAAWNIAFNAPPRAGHLVFRACGHSLCLNPAHLREAADRAAIGLHQRRSGSRVGTGLESRRANIVKAWSAQGITPTPADTVRAIRAARPGITNRALAALHGISHSTVCNIRLGHRHRGIM